jgi:hypothetical protein
MSLEGIVLRLHSEWSAKGKSYDELLQRLQKNERTTYERLLNAAELTWNRVRTCHVIGIERWGTHRLRTLLGEPLILDEYDGYAPSEELSMAKLATEFKRTRAATNALVRELQHKGISLSQTAKHNELGDLSVGGWLVYISSHTGRETLSLLPRLHGKANQAIES